MKHYYRIIEHKGFPWSKWQAQHCNYYFFGLIPIWRNIGERWDLIESAEIEINEHRDERQQNKKG